MNALDVFAGPGGWDLGARALGIDPLGVEWDANACATRRAAGLRTLQGDVGELDPMGVFLEAFDEDEQGASLDLLIGSPPCQAFSMAGKGAGRAEQDAIYSVARDLFAGRDMRAEAQVSDPRSLLVVEPIRWALALKPRWICLEQVPPVLDLWRAFADGFRGHGWHVWVGVLSAERYGVPQTRKRAILLADWESQPHPPEPTHQQYVPGEPAQAGEDSLLGPGLLPWVSMAQALGWDASSAPSYKLARGDGITERHGDRPASPPDEPAPTISGKARSAEWTWNPRQVGASPRCVDQPAPTMLATGLALGVPVWDDAPTCPTAGPNAVRVAVREAAALQTFPADHPWQGSRSAQHLQVGNAVPPLLAQRVLAALTDLPLGEPCWQPPGGEATGVGLRAGTNANDITRDASQPAPTLRFGQRMNDVSWVQTDEEQAA